MYDTVRAVLQLKPTVKRKKESDAGGVSARSGWVVR
jgi:hypothetical protein